MTQYGCSFIAYQLMTKHAARLSPKEVDNTLMGNNFIENVEKKIMVGEFSISPPEQPLARAGTYKKKVVYSSSLFAWCFDQGGRHLYITMINHVPTVHLFVCGGLQQDLKHLQVIGAHNEFVEAIEALCKDRADAAAMELNMVKTNVQVLAVEHMQARENLTESVSSVQKKQGALDNTLKFHQNVLYSIVAMWFMVMIIGGALLFGMQCNISGIRKDLDKVGGSVAEHRKRLDNLDSDSIQLWGQITRINTDITGINSDKHNWKPEITNLQNELQAVKDQLKKRENELKQKEEEERAKNAPSQVIIYPRHNGTDVGMDGGYVLWLFTAVHWVFGYLMYIIIVCVSMAIAFKDSLSNWANTD